MKIRSMTGFARVRKTIDGIDVVVSVKSVNHRGLDLHFYMSPDLDPFENALRTVVKRNVGRGHVDIRIAVSRAAGSPLLAADFGKLESYLAAFRAASARFGLEGQPDLNSAFRVPGILNESAVLELGSRFEESLVAAMEEALGLLNQFREREGAELAEILRERSRGIRKSAVEMEEIRERVLPAFHARLKERLSELLSGNGMDSQRLAQEAAILADRSDIGEELARLKIHAQQLEEILTNEVEIGKKLDFLLQEMNRETNTVLSKTAGIGETGLRVTELALSAKSEIEKVREQALNLE